MKSALVLVFLIAVVAGWSRYQAHVQKQALSREQEAKAAKLLKGYEECDAGFDLVACYRTCQEGAVTKKDRGRLSSCYADVCQWGKFANRDKCRAVWFTNKKL
jgi:hypothetical protein